MYFVLKPRCLKCTYHENNDEDEADTDNDEEGDQVVFQWQAEVWHEDHMSPRKTSRDTVRWGRYYKY